MLVRHLSALGLCWFAMLLNSGAMAQPRIVMASLEQQGILLTPAVRLGADGASPSGQDSERAALLPFAVVLRNATGHSIIGYHVRWTCTDQSGTVRTRSLVRRSFGAFGGGDVILPNSEKLISYSAGVTVGADKLTDSLRRSMANALRFYSAQSVIVISVELAVFDDGLAVGADRDAWLPRLTAWLNAERDFVANVLSRPDGFEERVRRVRDDGFLSLSGVSARDRSGLLVAAETARTYEGTYSFAKAYFAALMSEWIDSRGEEAASRQMDSLCKAAVYPTAFRR